MENTPSTNACRGPHRTPMAYSARTQLNLRSGRVVNRRGSAGQGCRGRHTYARIARPHLAIQLEAQSTELHLLGPAMHVRSEATEVQTEHAVRVAHAAIVHLHSGAWAPNRISPAGDRCISLCDSRRGTADIRSHDQQTTHIPRTGCSEETAHRSGRSSHEPSRLAQTRRRDSTPHRTCP